MRYEIDWSIFDHSFDQNPAAGTGKKYLRDGYKLLDLFNYLMIQQGSGLNSQQSDPEQPNDLSDRT